MTSTRATYALDLGWAGILSHLGLTSADVLRAAGLPLDLFRRDAANLTSAEYFALWSGLERVSGDPRLPLRAAEALTPETFSPALFACLCSKSLDAALDRLAEYKPLIGPMHLDITHDQGGVTAEIQGLPGDLPPPPSLIAGELVFFTHLARLGTRDRIVPANVVSPVPMPDDAAFTEWFGVRPVPGEATRITFHKTDAERPFLTANPAMWAAFEPTLRQRLSDMTADVSTTDRVRGWLNETIASGRTAIEDAARDLGMSRRTLQRRLSAEGTSFQRELSAIREGMARHYLTQTALSTGEIAFLLGYAEQNSFYRAFHDWTGTSPERLRSSAA